MQRRTLASPSGIILILILQLVPLLLFPPRLFTAGSQEWWLPALLAVMVLVADYEVIVRREVELWPWYLISFSQGMNIISRLMLLWPGATVEINGATVLNVQYVILTFIAIVMSSFLLWYTELPDVRMGLLRGRS